MDEKTINLLPTEWRRRPSRSAIPSLVLAGTLSLLIAGIGTGRPRPALSAALPPPIATPADLDPLTVIQVDHPAYPCFERASGWFPWDELLVQLASILGPDDSLEHCVFRAESAVLEITGQVSDLATLNRLATDLARWPCFQDADAFRVEPVGPRTNFGVRLTVGPVLVLEEVPR